MTDEVPATASPDDRKLLFQPSSSNDDDGDKSVVTSSLRPRAKRQNRQPVFAYAAGHLARCVVLLRRMQQLGRYSNRARRLELLADVLEKFIPEIQREGE